MVMGSMDSLLIGWQKSLRGGKARGGGVLYVHVCVGVGGGMGWGAHDVGNP